MNPWRRAREAALGLLALTLVAACGSSASPATPGAPTTLVTLPSVPTQSARSVPTSPPVVAPDYLADGIAATTTRRAMLQRKSPLRYVESGEPLSDSDPPSSLGRAKEVVVLSENTSNLRVLVEWRDLRLLLFAERSVFAQVPRERTLDRSAPDLPADETTGVQVAPGSVLVEKERRGASVRIEGEIAKVTFDGWIPAETLGVVFEPAPFGATSGTGHVRERTTVLASPKGPTIAKLGAFGESNKRPFSFIVEPESGAPPGYQRIRYRAKQVELRGLVASVDYRANPAGSRLGGEHEGRPAKGAMSDSLVGVLPREASLYAPEDGSRIGRVLEPQRVYLGQRRPEQTDFVTVQLWAGELGLITALAKASDIGPEAPR
jgi:hypothetical protein